MPLLVPFLGTPTPPPAVTVQAPAFQLWFRDGATSVFVTTVETASTQIGRTSPRTDGAGAGTATITIDDTARVLDPDNTSSALYGHLTPGGTTNVYLSVWNGSQYQPLFSGLIQSIQTSYPGGTSRTEATLQLVDATRDLTNHIPAASLNDANSNPIPTYVQQQTGARISALLGANSRSGWGWLTRAQTGAFAIDAGQKVLGPLALDGSTSTWQYVADAALAEKGLAFFDQAGVMTFHDQVRRYRSSTPAWVMGDDSTSEVWVDPSLTFMLPNDRVITDVAYTTSDAVTSVYGPGGASTMTSGGTSTQLADQYQGAARARWEYENYSINRRDAPTVEINALDEWPSLTSLSRFNAAINVNISDYVTLNRRPGVGSTITKHYWVDAIAHNIAYNAWTTTFTLVAADAIPGLWVLGTTPLSGISALTW